MPKKQAVVVLGMHRSGTSMVTRLISLMGAALPAKLLRASSSNETGHWEPERIVNINETMLHEAGSRWADWRPFDPAVLGPERTGYFRENIKRILDEEYKGAPLIVLKEPRICRMVPLYESLLDELGYEPVYLFINRNPLAVMASLNRRSGLSKGFSWLMYVRHELDAEAATRGKRRVFVSYEAIMENWRDSLGNAIGRLDVAWPRPMSDVAAEIDEHIRPDLRHHKPAEQDIGAEAGLPWLPEVRAALLDLQRDGSDRTAMRNLDRIRGEFDTEIRSNTYLNIMFEELRSNELYGVSLRHKLRERLKQGQDQLTDVLARYQSLSREMVRKDAELKSRSEISGK